MPRAFKRPAKTFGVVLVVVVVVRTPTPNHLTSGWLPLIGGGEVIKLGNIFSGGDTSWRARPIVYIHVSLSLCSVFDSCCIIRKVV